ncbi:MBL fold metallo-hydrolase [Vibrio rumoiensis]|uniref:MBL fold metallo-hydrolase n=1 Tax=Vibrio rumoiensis TaxID=76258 RepID=UPI003AA9DCB7
MTKTSLLVMSLIMGITSQVQAENLCLDQLSSEKVNQLFSEFGSTGKMPPQLGRWLNDPDVQTVKPFQLFDNVQFVGVCWVSSWLLKSDQGLILIDSLYQPYTDTLLKNVEKLGYKLSDIKYVLITHGHFDHAGGVGILKKSLPNARIGMTAEGWNEAYHDANSPRHKNDWEMPKKPDLILTDNQVITLGNTKVTVYTTPGHTWGTTSFVFDVFDHGKKYKAVTIGGLGLNAISGPEQVETYIQSVDKLKSLVLSKEDPITIDLTAHPFSANLMENIELMKKRSSKDGNLLVNQKELISKLDELKGAAEKRLVIEKQKEGK